MHAANEYKQQIERKAANKRLIARIFMSSLLYSHLPFSGKVTQDWQKTVIRASPAPFNAPAFIYKYAQFATH
ncbi:hypothetical protein HMPREF3230_00535 [Gardnerella vaginalis]|uniref:Uncharacterized protein n=1 Tax=Gardnerella vaginalis TaxID=2702 RepID=A0A135Z8D7_GARVA|nr:hypothetical protein HMPREF3230_00535 [Gardnerella vaginalis]